MSTGRFVDTNVLVYFFDRRDPVKRARARELLSEPAGIVLSTQVLGEFYVVMTRKLGMPPEDARAAVDAFASWRVLGIDAGLVRSAVVSSQLHQLSYWDALIVETAVAGGCDVVLTEDLAAGATIRGVRIQNPFSN